MANPATSAPEGGLQSPRVLWWLFAMRESRLVGELGARMASLQSTGQSTFDVWMKQVRFVGDKGPNPSGNGPVF